ncbi:MADS-box protein AGL42-like isoform X2 [Lycium barbarum]|nr:MADS-box protein AGL42-like isoform X2 [Lycium barbarum]
MVRGKVEMKRIENSTSRQVTFSKRRNGLMKKAYELSVLCDAEVALIIFSPKGRLYEFSSSNMQKTIERYRELAKETATVDENIGLKHHIEHLKHETAKMAKKIEILEASKRKMMGQGLGSCSMDELQEIDNKLERSLRNIKARKVQLFNDEIERLEARERLLLEQNASLREKCGHRPTLLALASVAVPAPPPTPPAQVKEMGNCSQSTQSWEVETELSMGLPEMRCS